MPRFRVRFVPLGSWEAVIEAPTAELAHEVADEHFDTSARLSDAGWETENIVEVDEPAEFEWEPDGSDEDDEDDEDCDDYDDDDEEGCQMEACKLRGCVAGAGLCPNDPDEETR